MRSASFADFPLAEMNTKTEGLMATFTKWDYELAKMKDAKEAERREHEARYASVAEALKKLGIDPYELRDYLAGLA